MLAGEPFRRGLVVGDDGQLHVVALLSLREAEVDQFHRILVVFVHEQDIFWLEVVVADAVLVAVLDRREHVAEYGLGVSLRHRPPLLNFGKSSPPSQYSVTSYKKFSSSS